jgi:Zn-dependent peptidase ImmA (M78 family)
MMLRRQDWMREHLIDQGEKPLAFVNSARLTDHPNTVSQKIHDMLGLSADWARRETTWTDALRTLRTVVENSGIMIVFNGIVGNNTHRKLDVSEFRGFVLCDEYAPLIFINNADVKAAQMFTVMHELAHLWLGQGGVFNLRDMQPGDNQVERFCNAAAAEFLVPEKALRECWADAAKADEPFQFLSKYFKVSPLVAARRALDLGYINKTAFFDFYNAYLIDERRKASKAGGGDFYSNLEMRVGQRFAEAVIRAAKEGRLLYRDAFQLTGLKSETFDRYAKSFEARF